MLRGKLGTVDFSYPHRSVLKASHTKWGLCLVLRKSSLDVTSCVPLTTSVPTLEWSPPVDLPTLPYFSLSCRQPAPGDCVPFSSRYEPPSLPPSRGLVFSILCQSTRHTVLQHFSKILPPLQILGESVLSRSLYMWKYMNEVFLVFQMDNGLFTFRGFQA